MPGHAGILGCKAAWVLTESHNRAAMHLNDSVGGVREAAGSVMFSFEIGPAHDS